MDELDESKKIAAVIKRLEKAQLAAAFNPFDFESRPTEQQMDIFRDISNIQYRWVVAGQQSGKSSTAAREIAWVVTDTHPFWKRPNSWGDEPLLVIVSGQDRRNMEIELWDKKIKPFLDAADWRIVKQANSLQYVEHRQTRDRIVFISHSDSSDKARQHLQGYVAHYVWLDEMPGSKEILQELQERVASRKGRFIATFTPKFKNDEIRRIIDASRPPVGKKYKLFKLLNPNYFGREQEEIQKLDGYSDNFKKTILFGEWTMGDNAVYAFNYDQMTVSSLPEGYSPGWRHVCSLDPAAKSKFGYTLWAEDSSTGTWYLVRDEYIEGIADPNALFGEVEKRNKGYNVIRQVCDPHEAWYMGLGNAKGVTYYTPYDKNNRKTELIKNLQHALTANKIKIGRWCTNFLDEILGCQWSETSDRIINASVYHTLDTAQYFVDCIPKSDPIHIVKPWHVELRQGNENRKKANSEKLRIKNKPGNGRSIYEWGRRKMNV